MKGPLITLAVETSTVSGTVALLSEGSGEETELSLGGGMTHGRELVPAMERLLSGAGIEIRGIRPIEPALEDVFVSVLADREGEEKNHELQ